MSSVHNKVEKGTQTPAERVKKARSGNRWLLLGLSVLIVILVTSAFVARFVYLEGH